MHESMVVKMATGMGLAASATETLGLELSDNDEPIVTGIVRFHDEHVIVRRSGSCWEMERVFGPEEMVVPR